MQGARIRHNQVEEAAAPKKYRRAQDGTMQPSMVFEASHLPFDMQHVMQMLL
jgi:hypothetical protein